MAAHNSLAKFKSAINFNVDVVKLVKNNGPTQILILTIHMSSVPNYDIYAPFIARYHVIIIHLKIIMIPKVISNNYE